MPIVRYAVNTLCEKNKDRILKASNLNDIGEWDYQKIREYLAGNPQINRPGFIRIYHDWEDFGEINDPRTGKRFSFDFKPVIKSIPLNKKGGKLTRAINLNQKTVNWLIIGKQFNEQAVKKLNQVKDLPQLGSTMAGIGSVSELISAILNDEAKELINKADVDEIGLEKETQ